MARTHPFFIIIICALMAACSGGGGGTDGGAGQGDGASGNSAPLAPPVLSLAPGQNRISLHWSKVEGAERYTVYWSQSADLNPDNGQRIDNALPAYVHEGLVNGQNYYYLVIASNQSGQSLPSNIVSSAPVGQLIQDLLPDPNLQHCINSLAEAQGWLYADNVTGRVDCAYRGISDLGGLEHFSGIDELLLNGNQIRQVDPVLSLYGLRHLDLSHNRIVSPVIDDVSQLALFSRLQVLKLAGNAGIACADMRALKQALGVVLADIPTATDGQNCSAEANAGAGDSGTGSGAEPPGGAGTKPVPQLQSWPTEVVAISGDGQVTLHWQAALNAASYRIYWSNTPGVTPANGTLIDNVSSPYVHQGLNNAETYYYIVTAVANGLESQASQEVFAVPSDQGLALSGLFADANLQTCIDQLADTYSWRFAREIYPELDCSSRAIVDLNGLAQLSALQDLNLIDNAVNDLTPLAAMSQLKRVLLAGNEIQDLAPLSGLPQLDVLSVRDNLVTDLSPLSAIDTLTQLYADGNQVVDASTVSTSLGLRKLDLRRNQIGGQGIGRIDTLAGLSQATSISLADNPAIDCQELLSLVQALGAGVVDISSRLGTNACAVTPLPPQNVIVSGGNQRVILQWDSAIAATAYNVYWSPNPGVSLTTANKLSTSQPRYVHTGLANGATYYYVVTATNAVGESLPSAEVQATAAVVPLNGLFSDLALQSCIDDLAALKDWVYADEINGTINCSLNNIQDVSGIEHLTQLSGLLLNDNNIHDIQPLSLLPGLQVLSLRNNNLSNLQTIEQMSNLSELVLSDNRIINVRSIAQLTSLSKLDLSNNHIGKAGPAHVDKLVSLSNATQIRLSGNPLMNCAEIEQLMNGLPGVVVDMDLLVDGENCSTLSLSPQNVSAQAGDGRISLSWSAVNNASAYSLYWSTQPNVSPASGNKISVGTNAYEHSGLSNQVNYFYIVAAQVNGLDGPLSGEVTAVPMPAAVELQDLFPDSALQACVDATAGAGGWSQAQQVVGELNCSAAAIASLQGMASLTNVSAIRFGGNAISDINPLAGLANLRFLDLYNNLLVDVGALAGLSGLEKLYLHNNRITDISALSGLTALSYVILDGNDITDLGALSNATELSHLFARKNNISGLASLSGLNKLTEAYLSDNNIVDVSVLANLSALQKLDLRNNAIGGQGIGNVDSLAALPNVTQIWLNGNPAMSCAELDSLIQALGPSAVDLNAAQDGLNCTAP